MAASSAAITGQLYREISLKAEQLMVFAVNETSAVGGIKSGHPNRR
jgi:hypothetical protein